MQLKPMWCAYYCDLFIAWVGDIKRTFGTKFLDILIKNILDYILDRLDKHILDKH